MLVAQVCVNLQECCLCLLRGGALKPTETGRWAHLVCAVTIPEVIIGQPALRQPVVTSGITRARKKLVCMLCCHPLLHDKACITLRGAVYVKL